jgi:ketosteroid isomerase-like protein
MKKALLYIVVLASLVPLSLAQSSSAKTDSTIRQQIEAAEAAVAKAVTTKDTTALEKLWSPKMLVNSPANNILTRDQVIVALSKDRLHYSKYDNTVEAFSAYGDDLAVLMGHETVVRADGAYGGKTLYRRYTDIWQRSANGWMQIARQATYTEAKTAQNNK